MDAWRVLDAGASELVLTEPGWLEAVAAVVDDEDYRYQARQQLGAVAFNDMLKQQYLS